MSLSPQFLEAASEHNAQMADAPEPRGRAPFGDEHGHLVRLKLHFECRH